MKRYLIIAILGISTFVACSKKEETPVASTTTSTTGTTGSTTYEGYITDSSWKWQSATITPALSISATQTTTDFYSIMSECDRDNIFKYYKDSNYTVFEGKTTCKAGDPNVRKKAKYYFFEITDPNTKKKTKYMNAENPIPKQPNPVITYYINTLDANTFNYYFVYTLGGKDYKITVNATHKF